MLDFFSFEPGIFNFEVFGWIHILITVVMLIGIFLIYIHREKINAIKNQSKIFRYSISIIMLVNMIVYYLEAIINGRYSLEIHLPLHLCFISGFFFMYVLITNNKKLFKYAYFFSFIGPLPAIIFPDLITGFDRFIFWHFIISHHLFLVASQYCLFVLNWEVSKNDIIKSFGVANIYFLFILIFNTTFNTNYVMTTELPTHLIDLFPFLETFNHPVFWLYLAGILTIIVAYVPIRVKEKENALLEKS